MLGLEFQFASDILGTAVSPTFEEIGKLGAIATIRTVLNYVLAQEIERAERVVARERRDDAHPGGRPDGERPPAEQGAASLRAGS